MVNGLETLKFMRLHGIMMDIAIYSKAYTALGGSLVFKSAGMSDEGGRDRAMVYISYHDNNHYNSVRPPTLHQLKSPVNLKGLERLKAEMEHEDEDEQANTMETTESGSRFPEGKLNPIGERSRKDAEVAPAPQNDFTLPNTLFPLRGMVAQYGADLRKTISNHRDGVLNILREESSNEENSTVCASRHEELRRTTYPIMTGLSHLIMHLGGDEIIHADLTNLADQAEKEALLLFTSSAAPEVLPPRAILGNPSGVVEQE